MSDIFAPIVALFLALLAIAIPVALAIICIAWVTVLPTMGLLYMFGVLH